MAKEKNGYTLMGYTVKDEKNGTYTPPMYLVGMPELIRQLHMLVRKNPDNMMVQFPGDYSIWSVCEWDQKKGELEVYSDKQFVCGMLEIVEGAKNGG